MVVWLLTWAGLLLVILYSPIGSPDLYSPKKYFSANQGVHFSSATIVNYSPSIKSGYQRTYQDFNVPVYNLPDLKDNTTYTVSGSQESSGSQSGYYKINMNGNPSNANKQNMNQISGINGNMNIMTGKNSKDNNNLTKTGFMALTADLNSLTTNSNRQRVDYSPDSGATDPGDTPVGDPIPVGDGWWLLIMLAGGYLFFKRGNM